MNNRHTADTSDLVFRWSVEVDGRVVATGVLPVPPVASGEAVRRGDSGCRRRRSRDRRRHPEPTRRADGRGRARGRRARGLRRVTWSRGHSAVLRPGGAAAAALWAPAARVAAPARGAARRTPRPSATGVPRDAPASPHGDRRPRARAIRRGDRVGSCGSATSRSTDRCSTCTVRRPRTTTARATSTTSRRCGARRCCIGCCTAWTTFGRATGGCA